MTYLLVSVSNIKNITSSSVNSWPISEYFLESLKTYRLSLLYGNKVLIYTVGSTFCLQNLKQSTTAVAIWNNCTPSWHGNDGDIHVSKFPEKRSAFLLKTVLHTHSQLNNNSPSSLGCMHTPPWQGCKCHRSDNCTDSDIRHRVYLPDSVSHIWKYRLLYKHGLRLETMTFTSILLPVPSYIWARISVY